MPRKLYNFLPFILIIALAFQANMAKASHLMGGNITYVCNGNGKYAINLSLFRDCNGINLGNTATVTVSSNQCNSTQTITLQSIGASLVAPLCPTENDVCDGGNGTYGIEEWVYRGNMTLPIGCGTDWTISWSSCCRNGTITTGSANDGFYVSALLDNTLTPQIGVCNTAPAFNAKPTVFLCVNQENRYNQDVADAQNDSLVYSLVNCKTGANTSVGYNPGLDGPNPLVGNVSINSSTGEIIIDPTVIQVGVICALVEEYRNGVKIGEVVRDLQVAVVPCNGNDLPIVSGIDGTADSTGRTGPTSIDVCAGSTVDFTLKSFDKQVAGNVPGHKITRMRWNNSILGANFIVDFSTPNPTANFLWTPTMNDIGQHDFLVELEDNACPIFGLNTLTYTINVLPNGLDVTASNDTIVPTAMNSNAMIPLSANTSSTGITYSWSPTDHLSCSDCANPTFDYTVPDPRSVDSVFQYIVTISDANGCQSRDTVNITVATPVSTDLVNNLSEIVVFPNPSDGNATLRYQLTAQSDVNIELFDVVGRKVSQIDNAKQSAGQYQYNLSSDLSGSGIYIIRLTVDGKVSTQKVIVH